MEETVLKERNPVRWVIAVHKSGWFSCEPPGREPGGWSRPAQDSPRNEGFRCWCHFKGKKEWVCGSLTCSHSEGVGVKWCKEFAKANLVTTFCPTVQLNDLYLHLNVRNSLSDLSQLMESHGSWSVSFPCLQVHIGQLYSTDKLIIENQEKPKT